MRPEFLCSLIERFLQECSNAVYGPGSMYRSRAKTIEEQIMVLQRYYWGDEVDWGLNTQQQAIVHSELPAWVEGIFAVVIDPTMFLDYNEDSINYKKPFKKVLRHLEATLGDGKFINNYDLETKNYHRSLESSRGLRALWEMQGCPTGILLIPAQLGFRYRKRSVDEAMKFMAQRGDEFGLGGYEMGQIIMTHLEILQCSDWLGIHCAGDEYGNGKFPDTTLFGGLTNGRLCIVDIGTNTGGVATGSCSGFLP